MMVPQDKTIPNYCEHISIRQQNKYKIKWTPWTVNAHALIKRYQSSL